MIQINREKAQEQQHINETEKILLKGTTKDVRNYIQKTSGSFDSDRRKLTSLRSERLQRMSRILLYGYKAATRIQDSRMLGRLDSSATW